MIVLDTHAWMTQALARPKLHVLPLTPEIATAAGELGAQGFHGDPADRLIVATALEHDAALVTKDDRIRAFPPLRSIL